MSVSGEWSDEITALEKVMEVYNALGGEGEEQLADLVTPFRRLVRTEDLMYRLMPFSANKQQPCRVYIFRDVVLIATELDKRKSMDGRKDSGIGTLSGWFGSLTSAAARKGSTSRSSVRSGSTHSQSMTYRLVSRLDLNKTTIKRVGPNQDGFQLNHVYRQRVGNKLVTKIDMVEVWCGSHDLREDLFECIANDIETIREEREEADEAAEPGSGGTRTSAGSSVASREEGVGGQRKWARGKSTLRRNGSGRALSARMGDSARDNRSESAASGDSVTSGGDSVSGLSLSDLESRYQVDFNGAAGENLAEFAVTFGEGPMGFSLSSGAGLGVIVGKVADDSMASVGGVEVGDRVASINDRTIDLEMNWRDCVEVIKSCPRPVEVKFVRNFKVSAQVESAEQAKAAGTGDGQRSWAKKKMQRTRSFGSTIISLGELEKMYKSSAKQTAGSGARHGEAEEEDEDAAAAREVADQLVGMFQRLEKSERETERGCASVLREIFDTEKSYVSDLRTLIGDYMIPLRRTVRRVRCKDRRDGSTFCEHRTPRLACSRQSSDSRPVLEPSEIRDIFLNVETLVKVNTELLGVIQSGLKKLLRNKDEPNITDVVRVFTPAFVRVMPFFKMYSLYCHQYPVAIDKLLIARTRNKELNQLLKSREERSETTLQSLLIKPVQRICKYPLLFKSLLKAIIPYVSEQVAAGADMEALENLVMELEKALDTVDRIAKSVNAKVGEQESLERMMEIYAELGGEQAVPDLVSPHRRFLDKCEVLVRHPPFDQNPEPLPEILYVFNDHLVFATSRSSAGSGQFGSLKRNASLKRNNSLKKNSAATMPKKSASFREKHASLKKIMSFRKRSTGPGTEDKRASDGSTGSASTRGGNGSSLRRSGTGSFRKSGGVLQPAVAVSARLDMRQCQAKKIAKPDEAGCFGFVLTFVDRVLKDGTSAQEAQKTKNGSLSEKVITTIEKFEIWLGSEPARDELLSMIQGRLETLANLDAQTKQATHTVGPVSHRKTREWANRTRTRDLEKRYAGIQKPSASGKADPVLST